MGFGFFRSLSRAFGSERTEAVSRRGRQPRLAVIDAAKVDGRRHLVLIRRDNVEHLLMIGGPTDIVVEPAIVRAREPALARPPAFVEATQHPAAPAMSAPPPPHRHSATTEEPVSRDAKAEPPLPSAPRQPRPADQLAGLVAELSLRSAPEAVRAPRDHEASREPQPPGAAPLQNAPAEAVFTPNAEHNSAEAAQRLLEAVLRRPPRS